jgi:hypothetical protein
MGKKKRNERILVFLTKRNGTVDEGIMPRIQDIFFMGTLHGAILPIL